MNSHFKDSVDTPHKNRPAMQIPCQLILDARKEKRIGHIEQRKRRKKIVILVKTGTPNRLVNYCTFNTKNDKIHFL